MSETREQTEARLGLAERLVELHVLLLQSGTMALIQEACPEWFDDAENLYVAICPKCGKHLPADYSAPEDSDAEYKCPSCEAEFFSHPESEPREVYEWWAVSDFLASRLLERGACIYNGPDAQLWGRCATGQAIALDSVIQDIAVETYGW